MDGTISKTASISSTAVTTEKAQKTAAELRTQTSEGPEFDDLYILGSFIILVVLSVSIYIASDYVWLEKPTADLISMVLTLFNIENYPPANPLPESLRGEGIFLEGNDNTPGIYIPSNNTEYWIVKACTGMQAGAILLALIAITEAPWRNKILAAFSFFIFLFIGNSLRIAFHLITTTILVTQFGMDPMTAFYWGHDIPTKIIGFFGTLFFAWVIERMGVPIIDTFADFMEYAWIKISWVLNKI